MSDRRRRNAPVLGKGRRIGGDRRSAPRYPTSGTAAVIGWTEGGEQRTIAATLIDISMGGFSAWVETFPPREGTVWLHLDGEDPSTCLKASVIATIKTGCLFWTRRQVRFRFVDDCPYDFFKGAIEGFTYENHYRDPMFEGSNSRHWR